MRSVKSTNLNIIRKLMEYSLKNVGVKAVFTFNLFEKMPFEYWAVLAPVQRGTGNKGVTFSVKKQQIVQLLLKLLEK